MFARVVAAMPYLVCELCSIAGVIVIGTGFGAGFLGFGFTAVASPEAATADAPSLTSLGAVALGFGFVAAVFAEAAAVDDALSFARSLPAMDLGFGFVAGAVASLADAPSLSSLAVVGLTTAVFFFSGFDSLDACDPAAGGLVPV